MSRKLRVLHLGNGEAFKIEAIVSDLLARGHEIHMIPIPPIPDSLPGVVWHCLPDARLPSQLNVLRRFLAVRELAKRLNPDIVHAHNAWGPGWFGAFAGSRPYVIHAYGGDLLPDQYMNRPRWQRRMTAWAVRRADRVIVTGRHMRDASRHFGLKEDRITVLPRGVDLERYRPGLDVESLKDRLRIRDRGPVILSPRYQVDEALYNLDIVVEAFARVREEFPGAVCLQLCDSARESGVRSLESLAAKHGLGESYRLVQQVANGDMPSFYNLADVVVSVPSSDGFPVSVLEASACECAVVASDLPYCREWFEPGVNGLVVGVREVGELAEAVLSLCRAPEIRRRLGGAARALVAERADYRRCMDALESLYFELLDGGRVH